MLPIINRLKLDKEFNKIFKYGRSYYGQFLGIKVVKNELLYFRCGILVSSKIFKKAVDRNRLKRGIKSLIIKYPKFFKPGYDYVIITLPRIKEVDKKSLEQDFINNLKSLKLN